MTAAMNTTEPLIRFDDQVDAAAQLVGRFGYDEAERIIDGALRDHEPVAPYLRAA